MNANRIQISTVVIILTYAFSILSAQAAEKISHSLREAIRLHEIRTDKGNQKVPLAFADIPQDVDVNSVIRIRIKPEKLVGYSDVIRPETQRIIDALNTVSPALQAVVQIVENTLGQTNRLVRLAQDPANRRLNEFKTLAKDIEHRLKQLSSPLQAYANALKASPDASFRKREAELYEAIRQSLSAVTTDQQYALLIEVIQSQVGWINKYVDRAMDRAQDNAPPVALVLVARALIEDKGPQQVHLPHYDNLGPGQIKPLAKINWETDSEEMRRLLEAARPVANAINQARGENKNLKNTLVDILAAQGLDLKPLFATLDAIAHELEAFRQSDWENAIQDLVDEIDHLLRDQARAQSEKEALQELIGLADSMGRDFSAIKRQLDGLFDELQLDSLVNLARDNTTGDSNPVDLLIGFLGGLDRSFRVVAKLESIVKDFSDRVKNQHDSIKQKLESAESLWSSFENLPERLQRQLEPMMSVFVREDTHSLAMLLNKAHDQAMKAYHQIAGLSGEEKDALKRYAITDLPVPDSARYLLRDQIKDTYLDLRTIADRKDTTLVVLDARLFTMVRIPDAQGDEPRVRIGRQIDKETQDFVLWRFGVYSMPNVGVAYAQSQHELEGEDDRSSQFTIQTSWLFGYRSWISDTSPGRPVLNRKPWWNAFRIGPHLVALDMDRDNQQELGFGLTLSYRDLIQIGYGFNMALDNEPYYFIGLQLLEFGQELPSQTGK